MGFARATHAQGCAGQKLCLGLFQQVQNSCCNSPFHHRENKIPLPADSSWINWDFLWLFDPPVSHGEAPDATR